MEGERLLQRIKTSTDVEPVLRDLEVYLAPVLRHKTSPSQEQAAKYGFYAMKVLRACVQQLSALKTGNGTVAGIICIARRSYECICKVLKHTKLVPLSLEKLLFHMVVQGMAKGLVVDATAFATNLHERLGLCRNNFITGDGVDNEYDTVCKQAFNQLWKACVDLEHSSKQGAMKHVVVLDVRLQALNFLMLTSYEVSWVVERAFRTIVEFDRASSNSMEENNQVLEFLRHILKSLLSDLRDARKKQDLQSEEASELLPPLFELSLLFAKRCSHLKRPEEAMSLCKQLQEIITSNCRKHCKKLYSAAVSTIGVTLEMRNFPSPHVCRNTKKSKSHKAGDAIKTAEEQIEDVVGSTSKVIEKGDHDIAAIQCLVEALEFFKKQFECIVDQQGRSPNPSKVVIPQDLVHSVDAALKLLVDLLQVQREQLQSSSGTLHESSAGKGKQQRMSLQKTVNRQLATLNLMAAILQDRMGRQEEGATSADIRQMTQDALGICQRTQCIIEEVSSGAGGALSNNEHRWLGTNAYNLGLMCYRKKWYPDAVPLLIMACEQLQIWCATKEQVDEEKVHKVQLFSKHELLVDCQRKAGQHKEAMQTAVTYLWAHAGHLTDQLTTAVEYWVKAKRDTAKNAEDERLRTRTLLDAIQEIEGTISDESSSLVSKLLEQELSIYKAQRYDTTVEQYAVVCDLLSLYSEDRMRLHRAHARIEQAQLLRDGTLDTDCSPVDCCQEAIHLLEELAQDIVQQQQDQEASSADYLVVFDLLATAHFWLYICQSEASQATYITSQFANTKGESTRADCPEPATIKKDKSSSYLLSTSGYTLATEHSATEPLDRALDIWTDLVAEGCSQSMFNDPACTSYCLKVAASLCELADRPIQQVQALNLLAVLSISTSSNEDTVLAYCQIIQALCRMGAVEEATALLAPAQALMGEAETEGEDGAGLQVAFTIAKCYVVLAAHKIGEFEMLLEKVLQIHSHKRRSRQAYLRNASIKHLQALYLLRPPSERSQDASVQRGLVPDDLSPLELQAEAMRLQMGVGRLMFGEGVFGNEQSLQGEGFKLAAVGNDSGGNDLEFNQWTVLANVLRSLYDVGSLYLEQGCTREAKSYLKEGLLLADKFMLPRRSVAFLLQLSNLHVQCGQEDDCQASLSKVQQILHLPEKAAQARWRGASMVIQDERKSSSGSETHEETDDDNFIRTKRISISAECSSTTWRLEDTDNSSSPWLKAQTVKLPSYHSHPSDCLCASCADVSLHAQDITSFLRLAQRLELQGEPTHALANLRVALDIGDWSATKTPSLLRRSSSCLHNDEGVKQTKGPEMKLARPSRSSGGQVNLHARATTEIHVCIARLTLLNGNLSEAEHTIAGGLELSIDENIPKAWLHFYRILVSLELKARATETTVGDLTFSTWDLQPSSRHHKDVPSYEGDLVSQFHQLDLGKQGTKHQTQFQDMVFSERMQRPEVSRKLSEKVTELGIFCDVSDNEDDSDGISHMPACSTKSSRKLQQLVQATPHNVASRSKKGALMFSVKKKRPAKKTVEVEATPLHSAPLSAFDFDEPSPTKTKRKATRGRSSKSAKKISKRSTEIIDLCNSDDGDVFEDETENKGRKTATESKRQTAKKSVRLNLDAETFSNPLENEDLMGEGATSKPSQKSIQPTQVGDTETKPRRGRKPRAANTELAECKVTATRPKRGRKPNVENLRSEVVTQVSNNMLLDLLPTFLELESPTKVHSLSPGSPNHGSLNFDFESSPSTRDIPTPDSLSERTSLALPDLDEIEIPRAASDSDGSRSALNVRRKTARKPATSRRKTAKKWTVEDTEVPRGAKNAPVDALSTRRRPQQQAVIADQDGIAQTGLSNLDTSLDSVIAGLEQISTQVCHRAPSLLYRRVCQLLAACHGDREPMKAAYYLSEAAAVTLRHQKLASLAKKMKKLKKELDADGVQNLRESLAEMALDGRSKASTPHGATLQHLAKQRALFNFCEGSVGDAQPDVVQQTLTALPEGWTVCILSVVSSSVSLTSSLTDADHLVMCRLSSGHKPVIINQAMHTGGLGLSATSLLAEFDGILAESKLSVKETDKRAWWTCRQQLDQRMQALTEAMEETFLGQWKGLLIGARKCKEERQAMDKAAKKFKSLVESACQRTVDSQMCQCLLESCLKLSKLQLSSALASLTGLSPGSEQHSSLTASVKQLAEKLAPTPRREPVILILDKQIQQLPWETTPILRESPVCRMPSLYFILSWLRRASCAQLTFPTCLSTPPPIDPSDAFYVLNPSNDLANTQKTFQKWFEKENGWKGVVARPPTKEEYRSALTDHQLFVFCGHGNGREFLTGDDIQRLTCRATSLLIGCSSGRLHVTGTQEANGMVLNYLVAECPCLVANLWDVTDRDIDRFLEQLLRSWLDGGGSLLDGMAEARQACKLQHLIGCSPVVYGLPVCMQEGPR